MNIELLQVVFWITIPGLVICVIGLWLLSTVGEKGRVYSVDDTSLHIYRMLHRFRPKKIRLSDIEEAVLFHSWLEPSRGTRGGRWMVRVRYSGTRYACFMLSDQDAPDHRPSIAKDIFGYSTPAGADRAAEHFRNVLESHGVRCTWNR